MDQNFYAQGTEAVKGMVVKYPLSVLSTKAFEKMEGLRLLHMVHAHLTGSFEHLPKHVKWLCWDFCPLNFLPSEFHPAELVVLDLKQSRISRLWYGIKVQCKLELHSLTRSQKIFNTLIRMKMEDIGFNFQIFFVGNSMQTI